MNRQYSVVRSAAARSDLQNLFNHLFTAYREFDYPLEESFDRAAKRFRDIEEAMERLALAPFQGTLRQNLMPGLRQVTKDRAIFYFTVDEERRQVNVLAIFYGGQDHQRLMLERMTKES